MTQTAELKNLWQLSAPTALISLDGSASLKKPVIRFYRAGSHASTAHANEARIRAGSNDVKLKGDVIIIAHEEKVTLRTQTIDYLAKQDRMRTEDEVIITRPGAKLRGKGMEADSALNDITIFHQETILQ